MPPRPIAGRVVAITGAARGIGRATAAALVAEGARVAIGDLDAELAARTAGELGCASHALDVTSPESFERFLDWVEDEVGPLDVLVNNAGILHLGPFLEEGEAATRRQVEVNLLGVVHGTRLGVRRMRAHGGGHLVNVASSAGKVAPPGVATYTATKHAVVGLTESVRAEQRGSGIDFSIVLPGVVRTEMIAGYAESRLVPPVEPAEVAAAIVATLRRPRVDGVV